MSLEGSRYFYSPLLEEEAFIRIGNENWKAGYTAEDEGITIFWTRGRYAWISIGHRIIKIKHGNIPSGRFRSDTR